MKVYIGPYRRWIGPYQIADALMFWSKDGDRKHKFGHWLATTKDNEDTWLTKVCNWIHEKKKRKVKVRIDHYDTWNADYTLALIIVPLLKQMKKQGTPATDREDAPADAKYDDNLDADPWDCCYVDERWEYILGEMIWAFETKLDEDWDLKIYQKYGEEWTEEAMNERKSAYDRMQNGFRLFGKYYNNLWT